MPPAKRFRDMDQVASELGSDADAPAVVCCPCAAAERCSAEALQLSQASATVWFLSHALL
eukprot:3201353-Pleurochrysis_carterae.AAC.1